MMALQECRTDVNGWIGTNGEKIRTGKCSRLLLNQIAEGMCQRTLRTFAIYDEIGQMEGSDPPRSTGTKPPEPLKHLPGCMHKHYKTSLIADLGLNLQNHWNRRSNKADLRRIENEFQQHGDAGKTAYDRVVPAYEARFAADQMTGEWIIYAEAAGVNYYLTLATHEEARKNPDAIRERIRSCFAEFPELAAHLVRLGW